MDGANQDLHLRELRRITVPALSLGRDWDSIAASPPPGVASWQARQHALISGPVSLRVNITNTTHDGSFGDVCTRFPVLRDLFVELQNEATDATIRAFCTGYTPWTIVRDLVGLYTAAFLKTHLLGKSGYEQVLTPAWTRANQPLVQLFERERVRPADIPDTPEWPGDETYYRYPSEVP